ncbi:hypothetical protein E2I00_013615, partial [Balaenoptera physalus]
MGSVGSQQLQEPSVASTPHRSVVMSFSFDSGQLEEAVAGVAQAQGSRARGIPISTDSGTSIVFDMSLTYILVALVAVLLNNALVERLSLHTRITAGYLLALGPLLFISICDVWLQLFSRDQAYAINLAAVGTVAFGCTVQQSSFYGYTGMLPKRYTQGVMTGESEYLQTPGAGRRAAWALGPSSWDRGRAQEPWVCGAGDRLAAAPRCRCRLRLQLLLWPKAPTHGPSFVLWTKSEIRHCILGEWLPILIMAVFNLSDFVGKILAALPVEWRGTHLLACSCLRVVFIPLFILCVYPSSTPALRHPAWPCILSLLMGISNGYFGSVPMILAAGKVSPKQREL